MVKGWSRRFSVVLVVVLCFPLAGCLNAMMFMRGNVAYTPVSGVPGGRAVQHLPIVSMDCDDRLIEYQTSRSERRGDWIVTTFEKVPFVGTESCSLPADFEVLGYFHSPFTWGDATKQMVELAQFRGCDALALREGFAVDVGQGRGYISAICGSLGGISGVRGSSRYRLPNRAQKLGFFLPVSGHFYSGDYLRGALYGSVFYGSIAAWQLLERREEEYSALLGLGIFMTMMGSYYYSYKDARPAAERANRSNGFTNDLESFRSIRHSFNLEFRPYLVADRSGRPGIGLGFQLRH